MKLRELIGAGVFWRLFLMMLCAGASEQGMSQWASAFAEASLHIPKTAGDLLGPCAFAVMMGLSRLFFGKCGDKIKLERFLNLSSLLCVASYLLAALLISQLDKLPMFSERRKQIVKAYDEAFSRLPQVFVQKEIPESDTTRHLYILRIVPERLTIDRKQFFEALAAENVCCNVHYIPTYYFPYYEKLGYKKGLCPNAEKLYEEILSLPLYYAMTDADVESVIEAVTKIALYYEQK